MGILNSWADLIAVARFGWVKIGIAIIAVGSLCIRRIESASNGRIYKMAIKKVAIEYERSDETLFKWNARIYENGRIAAGAYNCMTKWGVRREVLGRYKRSFRQIKFIEVDWIDIGG